MSLSVAGGGFLWTGEGSKAYATAVGERRTVVLDDGTRIELNTNSRVVVRSGLLRRRVVLEQGEALFQVRRGARPYVVAADDEEFRAPGADFSLRLDPSGIQVMVLSGGIDITGRAGPADDIFAEHLEAGAIGRYGAGGAESRRGAEGESDRALSWRRGAIVLAGEDLTRAAAEFNRYNRKQLVIADPSIGQIRLGGYFKQSDVDGFARALQSSFEVQARDTGDTIILSRRDARR